MQEAAHGLSPKNFLLLTLAGVINALGITLFLAPVGLYDSGISGTAMLLGRITPWSLSAFLLLLNIPLFLYGLRKQGAAFTVCAIYAVTVYALAAWVVNDILPIDVSASSPLAGSDLVLCALFGGLISGAGSGFTIRFGGALDGIEVMAVIFAKRLGITVGAFVMIYNVILYVVCGLVVRSWQLPLYSIVAYAVALRALDFIVEGFDRAKCAMIITVKPDEICAQLSAAFETGSTRIAARGGFSGQERELIYFVVNRFQVMKMKRLVQRIDPSAYIAISEVADVFSANQRIAPGGA